MIHTEEYISKVTSMLCDRNRYQMDLALVFYTNDKRKAKNLRAKCKSLVKNNLGLKHYNDSKNFAMFCSHEDSFYGNIPRDEIALHANLTQALSDDKIVIECKFHCTVGKRTFWHNVCIGEIYSIEFDDVKKQACIELCKLFNSGNKLC